MLLSLNLQLCFLEILCLIMISFTSLMTAGCAPHIQSDEEMQRVKTAKINAQLGMAYLENKNVKLAKQKFLLALDQAPEIPETLFSMGYFFESTGDTAKAQSYYLSALKAGPTRGDVHNNYGTFLCRQGRYREAISQFMMATKDTQYLNLADVYENAANCAYKMGDMLLAKRYFYQTVDHDPTRSNAMFALAQLNFKAGKRQLAAQYLQRFLLISPPTEASNKLSAALNLPAQKPVQMAMTNKSNSLLHAQQLKS